VVEAVILHYSGRMSIVDSLGITKKIGRPRMETFLAAYASEKETLDVGSGNKPYIHLFPHSKTVDVQERPGHPLDYVGDAHDLHMIPDASFDVILCSEVLEHLHSPHLAVAEFRRILRPGGLLLLTTRFVYPLHETPVDYYRYTPYGLRHLLKEFTVQEIRPETNTIETMAVLCQRIGFQCTTLRLRPLKLFWFLLAKCILLFRGILSEEYGDIHHSHAEKGILSSGYFVAAVRA